MPGVENGVSNVVVSDASPVSNNHNRVKEEDTKKKVDFQQTVPKKNEWLKTVPDDHSESVNVLKYCAYRPIIDIILSHNTNTRELGNQIPTMKRGVKAMLDDWSENGRLQDLAFGNDLWTEYVHSFVV